MDDVIFAGTAARPAFDLAEVGLHIRQPEVALPGLDEVEELDLSRRIGRGVGSVFRINGKELRARDVQLLFADAASGARSATIVGQGQIGALLEAKPADRRRLLEEAAGVGGLQARRHEAELKLQAAEANLLRLQDLLLTLARAASGPVQAGPPGRALPQAQRGLPRDRGGAAGRPLAAGAGRARERPRARCARVARARRARPSGLAPRAPRASRRRGRRRAARGGGRARDRARPSRRAPRGGRRRGPPARCHPARSSRSASGQIARDLEHAEASREDGAGERCAPRRRARCAGGDERAAQRASSTRRPRRRAVPRPPRGRRTPSCASAMTLVAAAEARLQQLGRRACAGRARPQALDEAQRGARRSSRPSCRSATARPRPTTPRPRSARRWRPRPRRGGAGGRRARSARRRARRCRRPRRRARDGERAARAARAGAGAAPGELDRRLRAAGRA